MTAAWRTVRRGSRSSGVVRLRNTNRSTSTSQSIPSGSSLILTHRADGLFPGLTSVPPEDRPPVKTVFFAFRIMLAIGFFMIGAALFGAFLWWRRTLFDTRWFLHILAHSWWTGFVAVIAGWVVTETGRQPWLVHGILRTADAATARPIPIGTSLALYLTLYVALISAYISVLFYLARHGAGRDKEASHVA